mgnify:CR=1 FL=1
MAGQAGFWSDSTLEPKRKFRWVLNFAGVPQWIVKKVQKPTISVTEAEHTFLNYKFYYPGRVEFNEITITLADPVTPDATAIMEKVILSSGYVPPSNFLTAQSNNHPIAAKGGQDGKLITIDKKNAVEAIGGKLYLQQINALGDPIEEWQLFNPWIKSVNFDELDYSSDDLINLELSIRYDWATLSNTGGARTRTGINFDIPGRGA